MTSCNSGSTCLLRPLDDQSLQLLQENSVVRVGFPLDGTPLSYHPTVPAPSTIKVDITLQIVPSNLKIDIALQIVLPENCPCKLFRPKIAPANCSARKLPHFQSLRDSTFKPLGQSCNTELTWSALCRGRHKMLSHWIVMFALRVQSS